MRRFRETTDRVGIAACAAICWTLGLCLLAIVCPRPAEAASLSRQAGQMIMIGFAGGGSGDAGFQEIRQDLEAGRIGGVLFLGHNIVSRQEVREMTRLLRACRCPFPPLLAIDEEGGRVERLGAAFGYASTPSAGEVARGGPALAERAYGRLAEEVADAGFNLNLAPVVDLDTGSANPVIGRLERSFSDEPATVSAYAAIFVESHRRRGVLTSLKHFPGHGSSTADTHRGYVDVTASWRERELEPYRLLLTKGLVDTVMVGHISSNRWSGLASLSPSDAIETMLRQRLGFRGVVLTDDLDMGAVESNSPDFAKRIERAILAGNDILMVSNYPRNRPNLGRLIHSTLVSLIESGRIGRERIEASFERIRKLKASLKPPPS